MKRLLKRITLITFLGVAVLGGWYGVVAYRYWNNPPQLSRNYAEELNAPIRALPDDELAWPVYREVLTQLPRTSPEASLRIRECGRVPFVVPDRPKAVAMLRREGALLERVRTASQFKTLGHLLTSQYTREDRRLAGRHQDEQTRREREEYVPPPAIWNPPLAQVQLVPIEAMGELCPLLMADACLAARERDADRMITNLLTMMRIAEQFRAVPLVLNDFAAARTFGEALRTWGYLMDTAEALFDETNLMLLENQARSFAGGEMRLRLDDDRKSFADVVQRCYTDDGQGDGYFFIAAAGDAVGEAQELHWTERLTAPLSTGRFISRKQAVAEIDRILSIAEAEVVRSLWQCDSWRYLSELETSRRLPGHRVIGMLPPLRYNEFNYFNEQTIQQRDAILTASALLRYRRQHGGWPDDLEVVVPKPLPELPVDRLNGLPLGYRLVNGRPILYSRGTDGVDDGDNGVASDSKAEAAARTDSPVDAKNYWLLWKDRDTILWPVISPQELAEGRSLVEKEPGDEELPPP